MRTAGTSGGGGWPRAQVTLMPCGHGNTAYFCPVADGWHGNPVRFTISEDSMTPEPCNRR
jgi:hypothetical protein